MVYGWCLRALLKREKKRIFHMLRSRCGVLSTLFYYRTNHLAEVINN
jgi:hypothetical protein